jgi:TolA-binding protein
VKRIGLALVVVLALAGCGSDAPSSMTEDASAALQGKVSEIRRLASTRQVAEVGAKLAELRVQVDELQQADELSAIAAEEILAAAEGVEQHLALITTTTTTATTTTEPDARGKGKGKGEEGNDRDD